jgi:hypothetical protein
LYLIGYPSPRFPCSCLRAFLLRGGNVNEVFVDSETARGRTPPTAQMVRAQKEYVLSKVKEGVADCAYAFAGGGGCAIINADSPEKLDELLWGGPMVQF